jgi:CheY-like chemotaxis protein
MSDHQPGAGVGIPPEHLAALSHELRTPLGGILGMAQLLETTSLAAEQKAYVRALRESGEHLLGLVNDVLDYARLGAAHVALEPTEVDLEELLRSVCELLSPKACERGLEIGWAAAPGLPMIFADEGRLKQILLNFAGNALKFVAEGGALLVAEAREDGVVRLAVQDTGPGVPIAAREQIFEPFRRLDRQAAGDAGGAGLGLAIAKRIAGAMGGAVGVSGGPGEGATFWFEIRAPLRPRFVSPTPLEGRVVAIASPSPILREAAARQVEASGGVAVRASNLAQALEATGETSVVLADHAEAGGRLLPKVEGREIVVMLRPDERRVIDGYRRDGFAGYLIKPLRRASVVLRVLAALKVEPAGALAEDERLSAWSGDGVDEGAYGRRVLLAEDDPVNAMLARTFLRREGCEVDHVDDGDLAVASALRTEYDLILMDLRMPRLGGMEATRGLRDLGVLVPVVALTADAFEDDRIACLAAGMNDFLVKPLGRDALRGVLARWTRRRWTPDKTHAKLTG